LDVRDASNPEQGLEKTILALKLPEVASGPCPLACLDETDYFILPLAWLHSGNLNT
jgi:hypothetical protein